MLCAVDGMGRKRLWILDLPNFIKQCHTCRRKITANFESKTSARLQVISVR